MKFLAVLFTLLMVALAVYKLAYPTYRWHQKMTVEVEVGGKLYSGSSVVAISVTRQPRILPAIGSKFETRGEAVVVELPDNKFLFALQKGIGPIYTGRVFRDKINMRATKDRWASKISGLRETRDILPKLYPWLVTFKDINDPTSVQKVDPDDLAAHFGQGVRLKRITLEITSVWGWVTKGKVENVLGWFYDVKSLFPRSAFPKLAKDLTPEQKVSLNDFIDWRTQYKRRKGSK